MNIVTDTSLALFHDSIAQAWDALYKNDLAGAMSHARQAATIGPDLPETFHILGLLASRDGRSDIALPLLEKALAAGATERRYRDLAEASLTAGDAQSALAYLQQALREFERSAEVCGLLAAVYVALDDYAAAAEHAKEAITLKPHLMAWEGSLAFCHLIQGDYTNGFKIYTGRSQNLGSSSRCPVLHFTKPGELWLKNEQGPGDTLFFARFAKPLAEAGWKIHLQTDKKTKVLLRDTGLFASVKEAITPPLNAFWLNMGDLPLAAIQIGATEIQPPLDLLPDQARINKVRDKLAQIGPAPYIAVTWRAGARGAKQRAGLRMYDKIASPEGLGRLLSSVNATIISIQRVPDSEEQAVFAAALGRDFINFSHYNDNLQDMLALLSVVDEYVAVPNTNVHLRESLHLSSHVLVNRPYQDWRWLAEGSTSPWYPNSTVYRQDVNQDWTAALTALAGVLHERFELINSDSATLAISKPRMMQNEVEQMLQNGWAAVNSGDIAGAIQAAQSVMQLTAVAKPGNENPEALHLLGWAALRDAKHELAINILQRAADLSQTDGRILGDYVRALSAGKRHHEAIECASDALCNSAVKNVSSIYFSRAAAFLQLNHLEDAIADYEACIKLNHNRLDAQEYCGMARLKLGDAVRGFREYTSRKVASRDELLNDWCCPVLTPQHKGARVLIKRDMGLGDELTYLRYLPWLKTAGIKVDYWAGRKLVPVLERMGYFDHVYPDSEEPPYADEYDLSFIVNDLPVAAHRLGAPDIAPPLALSPRADLVDKWQAWLKSLGDGPYIGLNWKAGVGTQGAGNIFSKLAKAVDSEQFAMTLAPVKATWISLQRNVMCEELAVFENNLGASLHDTSALTDDIEDLLALLSLLDENVGVSNTNMHLRAGLGLGSKVLVQTPSGDWRWGYQGHQSLWFMNSKVYRQHLSEDWSKALHELQVDLISAYGNRTGVNKTVSKHTTLVQSGSNASNKRVIWLTAGVIKNEGAKKTSTLASTRYRVLAPAAELEKLGWHSEFVNEAYAQAMGGWGSHVPQKGDTVIISKVFTDFSVKLAQDAKNRGATVIVDFCDNFLTHGNRGQLQKQLIIVANKISVANKELYVAFRSNTSKPIYLLPDINDDADALAEKNEWYSLISHTEEYIEIASEEVQFPKDNKSNPKVLIGILYSGEQEFEQCITALNAQTYKDYEYFVIENLPNKLAHDTLYASFMAKAKMFDYFLKLDADMIFNSSSTLKDMVETSQKNKLAHLFAYVYDCPSGISIPGIQIFASSTEWLGSNEQLNVDYPPRIMGNSKQFINKSWIRHMPNPSDYQLFRYGIHKALKSLQPDRDNKNIKKGILHLSILNGMARNLFAGKNEKLWYALIGASLVYDKQYLENQYNTEQTRTLFNDIQNNQKLYEQYKKLAHAFWINEIQTTYWWLENFNSFKN